MASPESRASRIALGAAVAAAPAAATCLLLAQLFNATLFDYLPLVSDEIAYQRQIAAFVEAGFGAGYFTAYEQAAPLKFSHFSVHGPAFPVIYGLIGRIAGWTLYSGPIFNLGVLAIAIAIFLAMARASRRQILLTGVVLLTSWWVLLMASITMQESLNQAVMIVMAGFAARLLHPDTQRHGRLLIGALVILIIASVLRPTNWIVAVPLVLVGMRTQRPWQVAMAALAAAAGIPVFWLVWRYVSAPIPGLAIELTPATSSGAVGMLVDYFSDHLRKNTEIFSLPQLMAAPFYQHVMFESVALAFVSIGLAIRAKQNAMMRHVDLFSVISLGLALVALLGFYFDSEASISRVMAPFLLLALLVLAGTRVHTWMVAAVIALNLLVTPSFLTFYRNWRIDLFRYDRSRFDQFQAQLAPVLKFDPQRTPWCNTLLTTTYEREIAAVPAGIGLSIGRPAVALMPPIKSGYVLLTDDNVTDFGDKARLHHLATTVLGELYANRDAGCDPDAISASTPAGPPNVLPASAVTTLAASLKSAQPHKTHQWRDTPPFNDDGSINGYIEISLGDRRKWEFDMRANRPAIDRILPESVGGYPVNYGYVPQTVSYDGDPFDVLVLGPPLPEGQFVRGIAVGVMYMEDEKGLDSKVVISRTGPDGRPLHQLTAAVQQEIGDYFRRYKLHESGKFSTVPGWGAADEGLAFVRTTHAFFEQCRERVGACTVGQ